ncbi:hypothetical protein NE237_031294 [Protea cynaroides]|uniref:Uncharacterized protein n=1 Tax=Protea cynaroides TaxID=273540 RepID=A0A9Q0R2D1_9MAGN|nr:hypothetical protein NE237_031294 [Protea cynaroides]
MMQVLNIIKWCIFSESLHIVFFANFSGIRRGIAVLDQRQLGRVILQVFLLAKKIMVSLAWAVTICLTNFDLILRRRWVGCWVDLVKEPINLDFPWVGLRGKFKISNCWVHSSSASVGHRIPAPPTLLLANSFNNLQSLSDDLVSTSDGERDGCPTPLAPFLDSFCLCLG